MQAQALAIKQRASDRFSQWAGRYDKSILQNLVFRHSHDMFIREINPHPRNRISLLDVGCGTGELVFKIVGYSYNVEACGIDISYDMIKIAKAKLRSDNIKFEMGDVENLPYEDETFDVITCSHSFHHYPNQKRAVSEMHRVLRDNGRLMVIDGSRDKILGKVIFGTIIKKIEKDIHHVMATEMKELFQSIGFRDIMQKTFNFVIPLLFTIGAKRRK